LAAVAFAVLAGMSCAGLADPPARITWAEQSVTWQQVGQTLSFRAFPEREIFSNLDRSARVIFAVQTGRKGPALDGLRVRWRLNKGAVDVCQGVTSLTSGLAAVDFALETFAPGAFTVQAQLLTGGPDAADGKSLAEHQADFQIERVDVPPQSGRIPIILPRGVPSGAGAWPIHFGVPFPKGTLWQQDQVRLIDAGGTEIPVRTVVRSRWGHHPQSSIRWLGIDLQAAPAAAWWPDRKAIYATLEYGPRVKPSPAGPSLTVSATSGGVGVDTGPLQFTVRRKGFNLFDTLALNGKPALAPTPGHGPYLVDHEGSVYRAANDLDCDVSVEEQTGLRAVIRVEGWYVRDGATGRVARAVAPTDRLCKFITRIEAYAGKPYVRVLHTWVLTYDSHSVRLRDVGISLPLAGASRAVFGQEVGEPLAFGIEADGLRLVQHLPHAFGVESGKGKPLAEGRHSDGWVLAETASAGRIAISHRDTWQRFPKELEVLPDALKLHVWPAHGRDHPEIDPLRHEEIHKLWFAHQGRELNLAQPWETFFAVARITDNPEMGVYKGAGLALAGVHASALGTAITSDFMVHVGAGDTAAETMRRDATRFQVAPHALAAPEWTCASEALGWVHPYDPERFPVLEQTIQDAMRGYWETGDAAGEYGMWLYRVWHHNKYLGGGKWELYRLYNATHHYEAFMPWLFYARSGDPFYLTQGAANIRQLTDVQVIHYDNPDYPHEEFHSGQKRLVGSTKHTNGFNTWGGDHGVFSHHTCYNAMMQAYYLTGDLRLRDVLLAWQTTIVSDRANPEFARSDRSLNVREGGGARDNANALGELIDLYQMTWHPALLSLMAPMLDAYLQPNGMSTWGQPLHNLLSYYRSRQTAKQLLAGVAQARATTDDRPANPYQLWSTHCPAEVYALAALIEPRFRYDVDAYFAAQPARWNDLARRIRAQEPETVPFCTIPDNLIYLPRVMLAVARGGSDAVTIGMLQRTLSLPMTDATLKGWTRCIIREDVDQELVLRFTGLVGQGGKGGFPVKVYGPDNTCLLETEVPEGAHAPYTVNLPKDKATGQYVVFFRARDVADRLVAPLTELPEVYHVANWQQNGPTRFFTRATGDVPLAVTIGPISGQGQILDRSGSRLLAKLEWGESMSAEAGPDGLWIDLQCRYAGVTPRLILSITPERWFAPDAEKLALMP
jgi:hypothetical protein